MIKKLRLLSFLIFTVLVLLPASLRAQSKKVECQNLHTGLFYYYSKTNNDNTLYVRDENFQREINREKGDTAVWEINWPNGCEYTLTYSAGIGSFDTLAQLGRKMVVNVKIIQTSEDYYIYKTSYSKGASDTIWIKEQPERLRHKIVVEASFPGGVKAIYFRSH